ncbi:phospholipase-like protein [Tanacetum coccineum]
MILSAISGNRAMDPVNEAFQVYIPLNIENTHWFLAEFKIRMGVVTFYDTLLRLEKPMANGKPTGGSKLWDMIIEQLSCVMSKHGILRKGT